MATGESNVALVTQLSLKQAAKAAGVSLTTLYRWIHQGQIAVIREQNGSVMISTQELLRVKDRLKSVDDVEPTFMTLISEVKKTSKPD